LTAPDFKLDKEDLPGGVQAIQSLLHDAALDEEGFEIRVVVTPNADTPYCMYWMDLVVLQ